MSWMKRGPGNAPPMEPEHQPYVAPQPQPFGNQQNMYPNYQVGGAGPAPAQQYWQTQAQQPQYNQQYGQAFQQKDVPANANQFYQQPNQYNQNYRNQGYSGPQQSYQQNYYQNQGQPQNFPQNPNADGWEDNWDWGWEDSSKQGQKPSQSAASQPPLPQQPLFHNANVIEESFVTTDSWNWAIDDKKNSERTAAAVPPVHEVKETSTIPVDNLVVDNSALPAVSAPRNASNMSAQHTEEVRTLNDRDVIKEQIPNLALGKRFHLDNLTPQWSIESQMSQESSDGPQTHSEGTYYRSENQSRNSSKSSPGLNVDNSNFNFSQAGMEVSYRPNREWSDEPTISETIQHNSRRESHDELSSSLQDMSITNHEKSCSTDSSHETQEHDHKNIQENMLVMQPLPAATPLSLPPPKNSGLPPPLSSAMPLPPPVSTVTLPPPPISSESLPPPPSSTASLSTPMSTSSLPPSNIPPPASNQNPFKHAGPFSHKNIVNKGTPSAATSVQSFPSQMSSTNLTSPTVVTKASQQNRVPVGFEANLETTPDNSERPDQPQMLAFRQIAVSQQLPDNLEVAPRNDRNEYLQTAHLSSGDYAENTDFSRTLPPPGLRRMVLGHLESEYSRTLNISGEEPPPGLARMVPGQQTEAETAYNQPGDNYMDRHIDGQPTDSGARPYRQAEGQQMPDSYPQQTTNRGTERRPIGLDRMVPGEPSNDEYSQYQASNYGTANEQRVVTGVDHDYPIPTDAGPTDVREHNVDGSDYSEQASRNPPRNVIGARDTGILVSPEFCAPPEEQQREVIMEGENLQDLSIISSTELTFPREQGMDGADLTLTDIGTDRKTDLSDSIEHQATSSRRQSLNRVNTSGEDSERDRAFKSSPRRDRDTRKSSRDKDRERDRDRDKEGRYSRGDRTFDRDERRAGRDDRRSDKDRRDRDRDGHRDRRDRDGSPDARRLRRSTRHRYETEDTDYNSDKERDRRRRREGSYTSKPPRPDDKDRRYEDRDRSKRYGTLERDRRYDDEHDSRRGDKYRDRYERTYRDIDPTRKYGNLRRQRDKDERRGEPSSSPSRAQSREAGAAAEEPRRRARARHSRAAQPFYDEYGGGGVYGDPYLAQRQQYQYYEQLRLTDPAAYMRVYQQLMAGRDYHAPQYADDLSSLGYDARREEEGRGSVHSGRSSATGLKGNDTDLNTDTSLNLHLEESTVRSDRMTPYRFSTAHIKGSVGSRDVVVVRPSYPVDGAPATVQLLSLAALLARRPDAAELAAFPGPLVKGVTHKKSVIEYCGERGRRAAQEAERDPLGYGLLWELLALMLRQNGVVVGTDIAELLMKNTREYEYKTAQTEPQNESGRESSASEEADRAAASPSDATQREAASSTGREAPDGRAALDRLRELLIYGDRREALEWAMRRGLWGHALALAAQGERRTRAAVAARFLAALPPADPLHTLYAALHAATPPAATLAADERWADWRPHAAILLANPTARPDHDRRTLTQLGDSLSSRGLVYSAQFCYVSAGEPVTRHPLAPLAGGGVAGSTPPRLALLLADSRCDSLQRLATNRAIFATEVYEYALSLNRENYAIAELQAYKLVLACRLVDCGQYERALAYAEAAARAVTLAPQQFGPQLVLRLAELADRLKYHDPALQEDPPLLEESDSGEPSPRHRQRWLDDVKLLAQTLSAECSSQASQQATPLHQTAIGVQQQYGWGEPAQQQQQEQQPVPMYPEPAAQSVQSVQYYAQPPPPAEPEPQPQPYVPYAEDWPRAEDQHANTYADPYWQNDQSYGYGEVGGAAHDPHEPRELYEPHEPHAQHAPQRDASEPPRAAISLPGARAAAAYADYDDDRPPSADTDRDTETPKSAGKQVDRAKGEGKGKGGGWLGGILTKLSLRAPNQMILPDDKNPSIVWDPETRRWRNLDGDGEQADPPATAPPRLDRIATPPQTAALPAAGVTPPVSNIFKMQRGRHIKKSYVDVLNPAGSGRAGPAAEAPSPGAPPPPPPASFLVPTPAPHPQTTIQVSIPPSPSDSPAPLPLPPPAKSGFYDPSQVAGDDDQLRSGV